MSHVTAAWISAHPYLFAAAVVLLAAIGFRLAGDSAVRSVRRADRRAAAAQARRARDRGLSLSGREADLLARLERPRWWRARQRGRR
jgi:hypothetical protein